MFTASRISSTDIRMTMTFLRLRKMPNTPIVNRIAATVEIVGEADGHDRRPLSAGLQRTDDLRMPTPSASRAHLRRRSSWRLTPGLWRSVSTMAPIMATSSTSPAAWK